MAFVVQDGLLLLLQALAQAKALVAEVEAG